MSLLKQTTLPQPAAIATSDKDYADLLARLNSLQAQQPQVEHTPGPWTVEDRGYKFIVHKPGDGYITRDVCRMDGSTMSAFAQEANARLIAAAPDLLEALHYAVKQVPELITVPGIRAAIAKATGEYQ